MCDRIANADEIEVTPEMIEAGAEVLSEYSPSEDSSREYAEYVFRAMASLSCRGKYSAR